MSAYETSVIYGWFLGLRRAITAATTDARTVAVAERARERLAPVVDRVDTAVEHSYADRVATRLGDWGRGSRLYRWLTGGPGDRSIEVDLRESIVFGPLLVALALVARYFPRRPLRVVTTRFRDRPLRPVGLALTTLVAINFAIDLTGGPTPRSVVVHTVVLSLTALAVRSDHTWATLRESLVFGPVIALFEPPPPRGESDESRAERAGRDETN